MIKRILMGLAGTHYSDIAIQRAIGLAKRFDAEITGLAAVDFKGLSRIGLVPKGVVADAKRSAAERVHMTREKMEETIGRFESACAGEGIKHCVIQEENEDPFNEMLSLSRYHDLMIFSLRSIFEYGLSIEEPQDTLERMITAGVRPIIAVSDTFRPIQRAMIAYSGSMESAKTMKRFIQLRLSDNIQLKIVTFQTSEDKAKSLLSDAAGYCAAHGYHVECEWNAGSCKDLLLPMAAQWQADIIVMGNSARNLFVKRLIGETALHVIRNADRPLFLCQ
jgi:nucleotide-binding universal stress UspA family protein